MTRWTGIFTLPLTMARTAHIFGVLLAVVAPLASAVGAPLANAQPPSAGEILVLRNGQTLKGQITRSDREYAVNLSDGQIRVKAADVELVCSSLEDGYQKKRAAIHVGNVHHHLELAQWCLKQNLLGPAAAELADAVAIEPNHPMVRAMQHRLKMAVEPPAPPDAKSPRPAGPTNEELDRMIRSLPHGAVEAFTQSVQPVLMNHCATGGCHGPQSETPLRLFRVNGRSVSRRITQRNLYTVLPFIDRENPSASRLLAAAAAAHGTAKHAIFAQHEAVQYQRLADWAVSLAQQPASEVPATLGEVATQFASPTSTPPPQLLPQDAKKAHRLTPEHDKTALRGSHARGDTGKASAASFNQSADPYDPDAFNRRHAAERETREHKEAAEPEKQ